MGKLVTIPKSLIENIAMGDKRVLVYVAILLSNWPGQDLDWLTRFVRYSTGRETGGTRDQIKAMVSSLIEQRYLQSSDGGMVYIKRDETYAQIYESEFQKIISERDRLKKDGKRLNHSHILLLLAHIRLHMIRRSGCPVFYSNLLARISKETGLSVRIVSSAAEVLERLGIIHRRTLPRYTEKSGDWHSNVTVFVNMENHTSGSDYDWRTEAEWASTLVLQTAKGGHGIFGKRNSG